VGCEACEALIAPLSRWRCCTLIWLIPLRRPARPTPNGWRLPRRWGDPSSQVALFCRFSFSSGAPYMASVVRPVPVFCLTFWRRVAFSKR